MVMRYLFTILFFVCQLTAISYAQTGEDDELDSLIYVYHSLSDNDTVKVEVCKQIAQDHYNVDSTILWAERLHALAVRHKMPENQGTALYYLAWAYYYQDDYDESMRLCYDGIRLADKYGDLFNKACHYEILSGNNVDLHDYKLALDNIDSAKYYYYLNGDSDAVNTMNIELYRIYESLFAYDLADSILDVYIKFDSSKVWISGYESKSELRIHHYERFYGTLDISLILEAKHYSNLILQNDSVSKRVSAYTCYYAVASMFYELDHYKYTGKRRRDLVDSIYNFCIREADAVAAIDFDQGHDLNALSWFYYNMSSGNYPRSKQILDSLSSCIEGNEGNEGNDYNISLLYRIYYTYIGDYDNALLYASKFSAENLNENSPMEIVNCTKHQAQKDFEAERERIRLAEAERLFRIKVYYIAAVIFAALVALFLLYSYIRKRKHFNELNERNVLIMQQSEEINLQKEELLLQRDELADMNKNITASINYASNIQNASLPKEEFLRELFHDYFLIYRPLHIVAGDFYWANRVGKYNVLVCADCTGHGVPGAFVSMLGISLLNEVAVNFQGDIVASEILDTVRAKLMSALGQDKNLYGKGQRMNMDGMDLAMVMIDYESMTMQFAGAYRPLWIWRDGEILQFKPDKMPIGIYLGEHRRFTNHVIELRKNDVLYMFSDGIPDQFGYIDDTHTACKHFSTKRLLQLLAEIGQLSLPDQKSRIEHELDTWKNGYKQLDDNILIGVRV